MPRKTKINGKNRLDKFYKLAKSQGYRSRAAFKLVQLNKKYEFLNKAKAVVDLCAAPGGWMQVASKATPSDCVVVGVDLDPIKAIPKCITLVEDITTAKCRSEIKRVLQGTASAGEIDVVLNDGAPNVGGAWSKDAYGQSELVLHSLRLAAELLRPGGTFVSKVFRSRDYHSLLWVLKQLFSYVNVAKPEASRASSAEIFFVCRGYLAPKKIDPKMFDTAYVFKEASAEGDDVVVNPNVSIGTFHKTLEKHTRKRDGYADGVMVLHRKMEVRNFLLMDVPLAVVAEYNQIVLSETDPDFETLSETIDLELQEIMKDLKVVGKRELKILLRWHKANKGLVAPKVEREDPKEKKELTTEEIEEKEMKEIMTKLEAAKRKQQSRIKRLRRKRRDQRAKAKEVTTMGLENVGGNLFSMDQVRSGSDLNVVHEGDRLEDEEESEAEESDDQEENLDAAQNRLSEIEKQMDYLYAQYKERHNVQDAARKRKVRDLGLPESDSEVSADSDIGMDIDAMEKVLKNNNPLEVTLGAEDTVDDTASRWFGRDLMQEAVADEPEASQDPENEDEVFEGPKMEVDQDSDSEDDERKMKEGEFEEVPQGEVFDEDFSDDSDACAERLALGTAMLRKKRREDTLNDAYNRFAFDDIGDDLPEWFQEDEERNCKFNLPVTKDEVAAMKEKLAAINAKPIKKIAEARARKRMRAVTRWEKVKKQAENIADNDEIPVRDKMKTIEKLYAKKNKKEGKKKVYVVSQRTGGSRTQAKSTKGAWVVRVDKRLKADKRGMKAANKNKSKPGRRR